MPAVPPAGRLLRALSLAALVGLAAILLVPVGAAGPASSAVVRHPGTHGDALAPCRPCEASRLPGARPSAAVIDWQNVTTEQFGDVPPASVGASLVYDVADHEAVWFGGCGAAGCAANQTWVYQNATWTNETREGAVAPLPRSGAMMDYDPNARAVVLFGGHVESSDAGNQFANDTWEFAGGGWTKEPSPCAVNAPSCLNSESGASFAFDANASVNASVLFGGCFAFLSCTSFDNQTWWFNGTSGRWSLESAFPTLGAPSPRVGAAMAYDPDLQALVLFGGTSRCGSVNCTGSDTWTYGGGSWSNVTAMFGGSEPTPRVFGSLTWDPALDALLLSGGTGTPGGPAGELHVRAPLRCTGDGVQLDRSPRARWVRAVGRSGRLERFGARPDVRRRCPGRGSPSNATWVFSALPDLNVAVAPAPQEVGQPVYLNATATGSVDPTFRFLWGDGTSVTSPQGDLVHVFPVSGVYNATVAVIDPNGSANVHYVQLLVHAGPAATIVVSFPSVDVGVRDTFTAAPVLGTGTTPYNVTWDFGSGPVEYGASVARVFSTPGNVTFTASIVDARGLRGSSTGNVTVAPVPLVTIVPQFSSGGRGVADAGVSTTLLANVAGGTRPYNFTWQFGDGDVGFGPGPSHTFADGPVVRIVTVTLVDGGGDTVAGTGNVSVAAAPVLTGITTSPSVPTAGTNVGFALATSGGVAGGSFVWTFGDGSATTGANATHSYASAGTYMVTAWWNDSAGGSAYRSVNLTIGPSISALTGFLLNPIVLTAILVLAAAVTALVVRARRKPTSFEAPSAESPDPPPSSPAASPPPPNP